MKHTPLGYDIIDGQAVINESEADIVRKIYEGYLCGFSLSVAASEAGLNMTHTSVKHILTNKKYLGDGFYPQLISEETALKVSAEFKKRSKALGRDNRAKKKAKRYKPDTKFEFRPCDKRFSNPIDQVEFAYSLIEGMVK